MLVWFRFSVFVDTCYSVGCVCFVLGLWVNDSVSIFCIGIGNDRDLFVGV